MDERTAVVDDTWAVVVHHRRTDTIGAVVRALAGEGLTESRILVVDNSDDENELASLRQELPAGVSILAVRNRGYGAAVNDALHELRAREVRPRYLLVATHEVRVEPGALMKLRRALEADAGLAAVGPTLLSSAADGTDFVWSTGGYSSFRGVLGHRSHRLSEPEIGRGTSLCEWLDGAFVLYRASSLPAAPFDESFFLYMEEVDLHRRLGYAGGKVACVLDARVWQSSDGVPARYFARNTRLLARKHHSMVWRAWAVPAIISRRAVGMAARGRFVEFRSLLAGWRERLPEAEARLVAVNPLGGALAHYGDELRHVCNEAELRSAEVRVLEPSVSGTRRARWLLDYASAIRRAKRLNGSAPLLSLWPVLGHLDRLLLTLLAGPSFLVVHDPRPLVAAVGYGPLARLVGRWFDRTRIIVHSEQAEREIVRGGEPSANVVMLPHPVAIDADSPVLPRRSRAITVMGQYKPDRDLGLMAELARRGGAERVFRVMGRGWPKIAGWTVDSRFLSEEEFDRGLREASVILIPYRRFYQSGVAVRALEVGTPIVGPRDSVLESILGPSGRLTAMGDPDDWERAISEALAMTPQEIAQLQDSYSTRVRDSWSRFPGHPAPAKGRGGRRTLNVVTLGANDSAGGWNELEQVGRVINLKWATPSGTRFARRALGLGIDSLAVAVKASITPRGDAYLATNPWIAFFLSRLTRRPLFVTGIYAAPGSRSWRLLRWALRDACVITTAQVEAANWVEAGGRAIPVLYGNDFHYGTPESEKASDGCMRIFVGGSSDRDLGGLARLEKEVLMSGRSIVLEVAVGGPEGVEKNGSATVQRFGRLSQEEFGRRMALADLVYLPLQRNSRRAAGHMITVGALEVGTPVVFSANVGMAEYEDDRFVRLLPESDGQLAGLLKLWATRPSRTEARRYWEENLSRSAYVRRVGDAVGRFLPTTE